MVDGIAALRRNCYRYKMDIVPVAVSISSEFGTYVNCCSTIVVDSDGLKMVIVPHLYSDDSVYQYHYWKLDHVRSTSQRLSYERPKWLFLLVVLLRAPRSTVVVQMQNRYFGGGIVKHVQSFVEFLYPKLMPIGYQSFVEIYPFFESTP